MHIYIIINRFKWSEWWSNNLIFIFLVNPIYKLHFWWLLCRVDINNRYWDTKLKVIKCCNGRLKKLHVEFLTLYLIPFNLRLKSRGDKRIYVCPIKQNEKLEVGSTVWYKYVFKHVETHSFCVQNACCTFLEFSVVVDAIPDRTTGNNNSVAVFWICSFFVLNVVTIQWGIYECCMINPTANH